MARPQCLVSTRRFAPTYRRKRIEEFLIATEPLVRSKSELAIANMLFQLGIDCEYERVCDGTAVPGRLRPDFSFVTADGDVIIWEHLGMLGRPSYKRGWEWKKEWYKRNGFVVDKTLFTSDEDEDDQNGLDSARLRSTADATKALLE